MKKVETGSEEKWENNCYKCKSTGCFSCINKKKHGVFECICRAPSGDKPRGGEGKMKAATVCPDINCDGKNCMYQNQQSPKPKTTMLDVLKSRTKPETREKKIEKMTISSNWRGSEIAICIKINEIIDYLNER